MSLNLRRTQTILSATVAIALLASQASAAANEKLTTAPDRESRVLVNMVKLRLAAMKPSAGLSPKSDPHPRLGGVPRAPGSSVFDAAGLSRFLQTGLQQSYNKSFQDGWNILHTTVQNALNAGPLPQGVQLALSSGRDGSYSKSYEAAYAILLEAMRTVANSPNDFACDPSTTLSAYFNLAMRSGYNKSYQDGWAILSKYITNLQNQASSLIPTSALALGIDAALQSSYSRSYQAAYEVLQAGLKRFAGVPTGDLRSFYFQTALECGYNKSYQDGYGILRIFIEKAIGSGQLSNFDRLSIQTTLQASYRKPYQAGYDVLTTGIKALLR